MCFFIYFTRKTILNLRKYLKSQNIHSGCKSLHGILVTWDSDDIIYCNLQELYTRPYLPLALRKRIIKLYHSQSHPSARVTDRLIRKHYICPHWTRDITKYCRNCLPCQTSKISSKNKTEPAQFDTPDARFQHVHIDIVGPLLPSNGHRYMLTILDRPKPYQCKIWLLQPSPGRFSTTGFLVSVPQPL